MITIEREGAQNLLDFLEEIQVGSVPDETKLEGVLAANTFFVDFYSGWTGSSRDKIKQAILHYNAPGQVPEGVIPKQLAEGFRKAMEEIDLMRSRIAWLGEIDASRVTDRVLTFLPKGTPLDTTVHITIDSFNNAFASGNGIGVSLFRGADDRDTFEKAVMHELHHVGFRYWGEKDAVRQKLLREKTGRAVAVMHVQNLLKEGMANYYCTPETVLAPIPEGEVSKADDPYLARLLRLRREERTFFASAEALLDLCLNLEAGYDVASKAYATIAFDLDDMMLPVGHYLGARMIETSAKVYPLNRIVGWIKHLRRFLPAYNEAAGQTGGFVFKQTLVKEFTQILK
jgi:hypothetical protein